MQSRKSNQKSSHILEIRDRIQDFQYTTISSFYDFAIFDQNCSIKSSMKIFS